MSLLIKINPDDFKRGRFTLPYSIRTYVDHLACEYEYTDINTKLGHLYYAFKNDYDLLKDINDFLKYRTHDRSYEKAVIDSLAYYIALLRTGVEEMYSYEHYELLKNMDIPALLDLLKVEMRFRAVEYTTDQSNEMVVEFIDLHYDYDKIRARYGITEKDRDVPGYKSYIEYITTFQETAQLMHEKRMKIITGIID